MSASAVVTMPFLKSTHCCRLSCGQSLLLDCGEGALGALCRSYGTAAALRQVAALGCLWVSHRHAGGWRWQLQPACLPDLSAALSSRQLR